MHYKYKFFFLFLFVIVILLVGCESSGSEQKNVPVIEKHIVEKEIDKQEFDIDKLTDVMSTIKAISNRDDCSAGYDENGELTVLASIREKTIDKECKNGTEYSNRNYHTYYSKLLMDRIQDISNVYSITVNEFSEYGELTILSREDYEKAGLNNADSDKTEFNKINWYKNIEKRWFLKPIKGIEELYDAKKAVKSLCIDYLGSRLEQIEDIYDGDRDGLSLVINELPKDDLKSELTFLYCLVTGLTSHIETPYSIIEITYNMNGEKVLCGKMQYDYMQLFMNGNKPSFNGLPIEIEVFNPNYQLPSQEKGASADINSSISQDVDYSAIIKDLKISDDIKIEHIGEKSSGINAILSVSGSKDELFRKQMNLTMRAFNLPIESIWFIANIDNEITLSYIDRERYNSFLYISERLNMSAQDWPIIAKYYWEASK